MIGIKNPVYRLTKYFLTLLLMANFCSAYAGAEVIKGNDTRETCIPLINPLFCISTTTDWFSVSTPSDSEIIRSTGKDIITIFDENGSIISNEERSFKTHSLTKEDELELQNEFFRSITFEYYSGGTCEAMILVKKYVYANGQITLDQESLVPIPCD